MDQPEKARDALGAARDAGARAAAWVRGGIARLGRRAKAEPWLGAALVIGALLLFTWIAWTVYVWNENGANAGLGVLISWPAVLAVLALVVSPFVGAGILIKRMAANGGPSLAIAGGGTADAAAEQTEEAEDEGEAEDEEPAGEGEGDSEEKDSEEKDSDAGEDEEPD